jgi:HlyD family secretion protein
MVKQKEERSQQALSNFDFIEVKGNVKPGEEVITTDMSEYKNTREIKIAD